LDAQTDGGDGSQNFTKQLEPFREAIWAGAETAVSSIKSFKRKGGLLVGMQYCDTKKYTPKSIASPGEVGT